jgi:hypothetical protein
MNRKGAIGEIAASLSPFARAFHHTERPLWHFGTQAAIVKKKRHFLVF